MSGEKRKRDENGTDNDYDVGSAPKHPLLESVSSRFQQNKEERDEKMSLLKCKRETEKVHSNYLKQNVVDPHDLAKASYAASYWAQKNGIKDTVPSNKNLPGQAGRQSKNQAKKQGKKQNNQVVSKNKSSKSSTVTATNQGPIDLSTPDDGTNVFMLSLRNKAGELTDIHLSELSCNGKYICPVLYCEAEFTSEGSLGHHMNLFKHSPCDALRLSEDTKLLPDPVCYKCPECDLEFNTKDLCREHMDKENHMVFYPPLAITAYLCPQCLNLFKTLQSCLSHMESTRHYSFKFPFKDDETDGDFNLPVAVAEEFVQDYIKKCKTIDCNVQCLDCSLEILSAAELRHHQNETKNVHVICALTTKSLADVFSTYITEFSCDKCHRLFDKQPRGDSRHICAGGIVGNIKADVVRTTSEFLKSCAFSLISSSKRKKSGNIQQKTKHDTSETKNMEFEGPVDECFSLDLVSPNHSNVAKKITQNLSETLSNDSIKKENITETEYQNTVEQNILETLPHVSVRKETTMELMCHNQMEQGSHIPEILPHSSVKKESVTESMGKVKQEILETVPNDCVKGEITSESMSQNKDKQELPVMLPHGSERDIKTEPMHVSGVAEDVLGALPYGSSKEFKAEPMRQHTVEMDGPSTSSGAVSAVNAECVNAKTEDSDSDVEFMEVEDDVEHIVISDSDSEDLMIVDDQEDVKPDTKMTAMDVSPSKKKRKKKKKKKLSLFEKLEQKRLQEEAAERAAYEKHLKFLSKEEKKIENNPDARQRPSRQAKSAANNIFERKKRRAIQGLAKLDVKKAAREEVELLEKERENIAQAAREEAEKLKEERKEIALKEAALREKLKEERNEIALKEAALREKLRKTVQTSVKQEFEGAVKKTSASNRAELIGKGSSSKQLKSICAEIALNDQDENLVSTENLRTKKNLIFLDLDNFPVFFRVLPHSPPEDMFVWAFYGGNFGAGRKNLNDIYYEMRRNGQVYISSRCGRTKDAADFALVLTVGKMDERLPPSVAFTIVSGDKGFCEIERIMHTSSRSARVVNPKEDTDILLPLLRSLVDL